MSARYVAVLALILLGTLSKRRTVARRNRRIFRPSIGPATVNRGERDMACQRCSQCGINWPIGVSGCAECGGSTWYSPSAMPNQASGSDPKPTTPDAIECARCGYEVTGYSKTELCKEGWRWNEANGRPFIMCAACEEEFAERRLERAKGAAV